MKRATIIAFVLATAMGCATVPRAPHDFFIAKDGVAQGRIVVAKDAPASTQYAAEELKRFLGEMSGGNFEIVPSTDAVKTGDIVVGYSPVIRKLSRRGHFEDLGNESYCIENTGRNLLIAGGEPRGTLYGVYGLLEDTFGCRWFTPAIDKIPKSPTLKVSFGSVSATPALEYREPFVLDCFDGDWAARNRMNGNSERLDEKHGGKVTYYGFVHTFESLLPPDKYYDQHPEYYSLVNGKRLKEGSQLCCTNEDVVRLVTEEVRKRMREHPEATVFSVSQNDRLNFCECDKCQALAKQEDSQIGPVLYLVNRVAKSVAQEFPGKVIDTLAYQYTRKPPKTMRPEPNVIVRLCSIECCFAHPFEACDSPENKQFVQDVIGWGKVCNRLWVWNYDTSFANYFMPYPNLRVRNDNIKFYERNNVKGIFEQDVYTTLNGELSALSGYLNAKLLWNANYDEDTAIDEFLDAVYGKAAPFIREYIDLLHNHVQDENIHMDIWIGPEHPLLDDGVLELADRIWDKAEAAVADQPGVLERVRVARLPVDFAVIERNRTEGLKVYEIDQATRTLKVRPDFADRVKRFFEIAERNGVTNIRESNGALGDYKKELEKYTDVVSGPPRDAVKTGKLLPGLTFREYEGTWQALPDFTSMKPIQEGIATQIGLGVTQRREALGLDFNGYFLAPRDGVYLFHSRSNDGSKLYLDGSVLIDNDGLHKTTTRTGIATLRKGYHPLRVTYFESGGQENLDVFVEGPGIDKSPIPAGMLWHAQDGK